MSQSDSGLSDALRQMADSEEEVPGDASSSPDAEAAPRDLPEDGDEEIVVAEVEDESGEVVARIQEPASMAGATASAGGSAQRPMARVQMPVGAPRARITPKPQGDGLKAFAAPIVLVVGVLLLVPGIWSLLVLTGAMQSEQEGATGMAMMMLVSWPVSFCLLVAGAVMFVQVRAGKKS